jgi:hypothetical protein
VKFNHVGQESLTKAEAEVLPLVEGGFSPKVYVRHSVAKSPLNDSITARTPHVTSSDRMLLREVVRPSNARRRLPQSRALRSKVNRVTNQNVRDGFVVREDAGKITQEAIHSSIGR